MIWIFQINISSHFSHENIFQRWLPSGVTELFQTWIELSNQGENVGGRGELLRVELATQGFEPRWKPWSWGLVYIGSFLVHWSLISLKQLLERLHKVIIWTALWIRLCCSLAGVHWLQHKQYLVLRVFQCLTLVFWLLVSSVFCFEGHWSVL